MYWVLVVVLITVCVLHVLCRLYYEYLTFLFVNVRINMDSGRSGEALEDGRAIGDVEHYTYYKKQ